MYSNLLDVQKSDEIIQKNKNKEPKLIVLKTAAYDQKRVTIEKKMVVAAWTQSDSRKMVVFCFQCCHKHLKLLIQVIICKLEDECSSMTKEIAAWAVHLNK